MVQERRGEYASLLVAIGSIAPIVCAPPNTGTVTVQTSIDDAEGKTTIVLDNMQGGATVRLRSDGVGMSINWADSGLDALSI